MSQITIDRSVVEQALNALWATDTEEGTEAYERELEAIKALRAALEQPQVEQPVAWINPGALEWGKRQCEKVLKLTRKAQPEYDFTKPLYTHPQPRQPLTDEVQSLIGSMVAELRAHRYCGDCYPENGWPGVNKVLADYAAFKRAHGIGGEK